MNITTQDRIECAYTKVKPFEKVPLRIYPMMIEPQADTPADMRAPITLKSFIQTTDNKYPHHFDKSIISEI